MKKHTKINEESPIVKQMLKGYIDKANTLLLQELTWKFYTNMVNEIFEGIVRQITNNKSKIGTTGNTNLTDTIIKNQKQEIMNKGYFPIISNLCQEYNGKVDVGKMISGKGKLFTKYDNADIYPANELSLTNHTNIDFDEYMRMIASYVLWVNTFNTFCGVKMENSWNSKIKDAFVYKKNLNGQDSDSMDLDLEKVRDLEINMIFKYLDDLANKHSDLSIPEEVRSKSLKMFEGNDTIFEECKKVIGIICENCGYDLHKTLSLSNDLVKRELARIGTVMADISDKGSLDYKYWNIIHFYIAGYKETENQKWAGQFGEIKRSTSPIDLSSLKSIGTLQHQPQHHQSQTSSEFVMPFMKQSDTTCSECAIYHVIYDIDDSRFVVNEKAGVYVPLHVVSDYINEYIQSQENKLKLNNEDGTIDGDLYKTIETFSSSHVSDVYLIELVDPSQLDKEVVNSHIIALKTVGGVRKIYDSKYTCTYSLTEYIKANPSLLISNFISLSQAQINILRDVFSQDKSNIINYGEIRQYIDNQESNTIKGQKPGAKSPGTGRIRNMASNSVIEKNKTNVNKRSVMYSDEQMHQMFLSLPEEAKQKIGELIISLNSKK